MTDELVTPRSQTRTVLIGLLRDAVGRSVTVTRGWPGDGAFADNHIWCNEITDEEMGFPTSQAGRLQFDDRFRMRWLFQSTMAGQDDAAAEVRVERWMAALQRIVAEQDVAPDGLLHQVESLMQVDLDGADGPDPDPFHEGYVALGRVELVCHARII